ncbi:MAG: cupin domain-containing protein [Bacteroidota bacterium]
MKKLIFKTITAMSIIMFVCTFNSAHGQNDTSNEQAIVTGAKNEKLKWSPCPSFMGEGCNVAVLHGNPKKPNADIFFRLEGNTSVPRHWHHSPERMVLISGKMRVNYDGQDQEIVNTGDYAYGPAERPHSASCISDEPCVLFIAFEDPIDTMPGEKGDTSGH